MHNPPTFGKKHYTPLLLLAKIATRNPAHTLSLPKEKKIQQIKAMQTPQSPGSDLPKTTEIKERIIRRVYEIIDTCTDPKKLMDTYEAISKYERENGQNKESIFDLLARQLNEK